MVSLWSIATGPAFLVLRKELRIGIRDQPLFIELLEPNKKVVISPTH